MLESISIKPHKNSENYNKNNFLLKHFLFSSIISVSFYLWGNLDELDWIHQLSNLWNDGDFQRFTFGLLIQQRGIGVCHWVKFIRFFPILMLYLTYKRLHFIMFSEESLLLLNMQWLHHPQTRLSSSRSKKRQEERGLQIYIDAETNSDKNENTNLKMFKIFHLACCPFISGCHRETH